MGVSSINHLAFLCTSVFRTTKCKIPCARTFLLQRLLDACWSQTKRSRTSQANVSYWDCLKVSVSTDLWFVDIQNQICWRNDKCFLWDTTAQPFDHSQSISLKLLERGGGALWKLWRLVLSAKHQLACVVGSSVFPNLGIRFIPTPFLLAGDYIHWAAQHLVVTFIVSSESEVVFFFMWLSGFNSMSSQDRHSLDMFFFFKRMRCRKRNRHVPDLHWVEFITQVNNMSTLSSIRTVKMNLLHVQVYDVLTPGTYRRQALPLSH